MKTFRVPIDLKTMQDILVNI